MIQKQQIMELWKHDFDTESWRNLEFKSAILKAGRRLQGN
jgi:hypothetical protein